MQELKSSKVNAYVLGGEAAQSEAVSIEIARRS